MTKTTSDYPPAQEQERQVEPSPDRRGWFKATRNPNMPDLIRTSRNAFLLAYLLAYRGRWNSDAFNPYKLQVGEAVCDYHNWGLSEQEFRNGRDKLRAWGFATFRATSRGTIGKLIDTRLFSILASQSNEPANGQPTSKQRAEQRLGQRHTKNKEPRAKSQEHKNLKKKTSPCADAPRCSVLKFKAPTQEQLIEYVEAHNLPFDVAEDWFEKQRNQGWTVMQKYSGGRQPMRDWRAALKAYCVTVEPVEGEEFPGQ